jgi:hypothetical protein
MSPFRTRTRALLGCRTRLRARSGMVQDYDVTGAVTVLQRHPAFMLAYATLDGRVSARIHGAESLSDTQVSPTGGAALERAGRGPGAAELRSTRRIRPAIEQGRGSDEPCKAEKTNSGFSTLRTALGNRSAISTVPPPLLRRLIVGSFQLRRINKHQLLSAARFDVFPPRPLAAKHTCLRFALRTRLMFPHTSHGNIKALLEGKMAMSQPMITTWDYIKQLFAPTDCVCIFMLRRNCEGKKEDRRERFLSAEAAASQKEQRWLRSQNAQGFDVWITINPLVPGAHSRNKTTIAAVRRLYLDLDKTGAESLAQIKAASEVPTPNYILNTSPGKYQVIWNVQGYTQETAEGTVRALVSMFNGDPQATDISRVLRLPGLHNKKYPTTFRVTAERLSTAVYSPKDFRLPAEVLAETAISPELGPPRKLSSGRDTSPSGQDFGYCCAAIWKSTPATIDVICAGLMIEMEQRYRARHKSTPRYQRRYAELTVTKARRKIEAEKAAKGLTR